MKSIRRTLRPVHLNHIATALLVACTVTASLAQPAVNPGNGKPQTDLPTTELMAGANRIQTQVAYTADQREIGLMYRPSMPEQEGMLFVFDRPGVQCFWMKNTQLPLTAAFIADDGRIVNLADMKPQSLDSHCSAEPVRFVLEMNQGWFARKNVQAGSRIGGDVFSK